MNLEIYCDGSCDGGVGIVFVSDNKILKQFSYKVPFAKNSSETEYVAVIYALSMINFYIENLYVYTDNISIISGYNGSKTKIKQKTKKLRKLLSEIIDNIDCKHFRIVYVKSHAGNTYHELADELAKKSKNALNYGRIV